MAPNLKYSKCIFTRSILKQVPWRLHVRRSNNSHLSTDPLNVDLCYWIQVSDINGSMSPHVQYLVNGLDYRVIKWSAVSDASHATVTDNAKPIKTHKKDGSIHQLLEIVLSKEGGRKKLLTQIVWGRAWPRSPWGSMWPPHCWKTSWSWCKVPPLTLSPLHSWPRFPPPAWQRDCCC